MRHAVSILAVAGVLVCAAAQAQSGGLFAYDASLPLQARQTSSTESGGARVVELSYASPKGGRVPATLVLPAAEGRHPAVVFQHGAGNARRSDFRAEAEDLARAGLASLLVDAPFNRPPYRPWLTFQLRDRAAYVQNVIDLRRAIDLLEQRPEVDRERIALVGFSYGGGLAGIVAGVERRLAAVVVMSGPGRITDALRREGQRQRVPAKQLARYVASMRAVDAVGHVGRASAPLLFQFGRRDTMPRAWFTKYVAAAPARKRVEWYPAGHLLCDCATRDRKAWLLEQLGGERALAAAGPVKRSARGLYIVAIVSRPQPIPINRLHTWRVRVRTAAGRPFAGGRLSVDGDMPAHGHGLPTRPHARSLGGAVYVLEGMKFQMPGAWHVELTIGAGSRRDQVRFDFVLR
jgi:dienelactone hydrolase